MIVNAKQLRNISHGDKASMVTLDDMGILCGAQEDVLEFSRRLEALEENLAQMDADLHVLGEYKVAGVNVKRDSRISASIYDEPSEQTWKQFRFKCRWVPGFFTGKEMGGILFGGCSLSFFPDFFAMFLLRNSFKNREKWLCYQRRELLAHELCHIARIGLESSAFEEIFAYQTASSAFRRFIGGIFHGAADVYWFVLAALLLPISQFVKLYFWEPLPSWPFWMALALVFLVLLGRHFFDMWALRRAKKNLSEIFAGNDVWPVLFRCTDAEIFAFSRLGATGVRDYILQKAQTVLRWQIMLAKFPMK